MSLLKILPFRHQRQIAESSTSSSDRLVRLPALRRRFPFLSQPAVKVLSGLLLVAPLLFGGWQFLRGQNSPPVPASSAAGGALPNLQGGAATEYLKNQGLYGSLAEAMTVARYGVYPMSERQRVAGGSHYYANNPAQQMQARFSPEGLSLHSSAQAKQSWQMRMQLKSVGYGARQLTIGPGTLTAQGNRVEYARSLSLPNLQSPIRN